MGRDWAAICCVAIRPLRYVPRLWPVLHDGERRAWLWAARRRRRH